MYKKNYNASVSKNLCNYIARMLKMLTIMIPWFVCLLYIFRSEILCQMTPTICNVVLANSK